MWSFPGSYANRGSGTEQASSDVEQGTGVDLRCGGGRVAALERPRRSIHSRSRSTPLLRSAKQTSPP